MSDFLDLANPDGIHAGGNHVVVIACSGMKKSICYFMPLISSLARAEENMILTDPKGELYSRTAGFLQSLGYHVLCLDFCTMDKDYYNVLHYPTFCYRNGDKDKGLSLLSDIINALAEDQRQNAKDPFWPDTAITTTSGYMMSDCLSEEFSRRRIYITGEITEEMAAEVCCQINQLAALSNDQITLWIMSPGGSVSAGMAILDTMAMCGCDIRTIVMGTAVSMAAMIASSGTKGKRLIGKNAGMMIHQALGGFSGQTVDLLRTAHYIENINMRLYEILAENAGASIEQIAADCDRDYHLSAEEEVDYGLADSIFEGVDSDPFYSE